MEMDIADGKATVGGRDAREVDAATLQAAWDSCPIPGPLILFGLLAGGDAVALATYWAEKALPVWEDAHPEDLRPRRAIAAAQEVVGTNPCVYATLEEWRRRNETIWPAREAGKAALDASEAEEEEAPAQAAAAAAWAGMCGCGFGSAVAAVVAAGRALGVSDVDLVRQFWPNPGRIPPR